MSEDILEITREQILESFKGTNFGPRTLDPNYLRILLVQTVQKAACGYRVGYTVFCRALELGLLTRKQNPTKAGLKWAYHEIWSIGVDCDVTDFIVINGTQR